MRAAKADGRGDTMRLRSGTWTQEPEPRSRLNEDPELIRCVLERVGDPGDLAACMAVCKAWREVASELHAWEKIARRYMANGDAEVTESLRLAVQKRHETPVPCFLRSPIPSDEVKRRILANRLLLLQKGSQDCLWRRLSPDRSALSSLRSTLCLGFDDILFTLDVLVDGELRSSTTFHRPHANWTNTFALDLPIGEVESPAGGYRAADFLSGSVTQRGLHLLNLVQGSVEVKVSAIRMGDLRMTQMFSYDTSLKNKFNWDLSWDADTDDEMEDFRERSGGLGRDEWSLWLYSTHWSDPSKNSCNSFYVADSAVFNCDRDSGSEDEEPVPGADLGVVATATELGSHYVLCDVNLGLSFRSCKSSGKLSVHATSVQLMEFFHYWTSKENGRTYYVELKDREFLECLEYQREWF